MLDIKDLRIRYHNRSKHAVSGVSLHVDEGEFILLTGESACGKSTFMQAVCGFIPTIVPAEMSGEMRFDGKLLNDPADIARFACMVQQDPEGQFCTETVMEEVAFGLENFNFPREEMIGRIDKSLSSVGALHLKDRTLSTLSGGEKQKVAIASMIVIEPRILILDEPTANLDPKSISEVVKAIESLRKKSQMTLIVVEHRIRDFAGLANRLLIMKDGILTTDCLKGSQTFDQSKRESMTVPIFEKVQKGEGTVLSINNLSFQIGGKKILDDISFDLRKGSIVALMGENGSGKTTLLRHITGLSKPQSGTISVLNHQLGARDASDPWLIGEDVGLVFQNPNHQIFETTVEKEIKFASENFEKPMEAAEKSVEIYTDTEQVNKNLHPYCLSFGQKRRLNIVSASSHGPQLILLDEPFAGQDPENAKKISNLLIELQKKGKTILVVSHDPDFARAFCTDVIVISAGRLVFSGPFEKSTRNHFKSLLSEMSE